MPADAHEALRRLLVATQRSLGSGVDGFASEFLVLFFVFVARGEPSQHTARLHRLREAGWVE